MEQAEAEAKEDKRLEGAPEPDPQHQLPFMRPWTLSEHESLGPTVLAWLRLVSVLYAETVFCVVCILNYTNSEYSNVKIE